MSKKIKVHMLRVRRWGKDCETRGTLCGRLSAADPDGMNVTERPDKVTCCICRGRLADR